MFLGHKFDRPVLFLLSSSQHFTSCQTVLRLVYCSLVRHSCWLSIGVSLSRHHVCAKCSRLLQISRLGKSKERINKRTFKVKLTMPIMIYLYFLHSKVFSILFIVLVIYLDMLCWALLVGPWLFLIASACVWLEMIRNWDYMFGYSSILLWMFFLYVEVSQRMQTLSPAIVSFSRPFTIHW